MTSNRRQQTGEAFLQLAQALAGDGPCVAVEAVVGPINNGQQKLRQGIGGACVGRDAYKNGSGGDHELLFEVKSEGNEVERGLEYGAEGIEEAIKVRLVSEKGFGELFKEKEERELEREVLFEESGEGVVKKDGWRD